MFAAPRAIHRFATRPPLVRGSWRTGKIERWHQTLKNRVLLENYHLSGALEQAVDAFVGHYNHRRYHESLENVTPADACFGLGEAIPSERRKTRDETMKQRRLINQKHAA